MYLQSLELQGFKSFPDKVKLEFDKGLTAVVGPNGSGKSNIGDAVRWVFGEQSAKSLRGGKMEDVIFSGTEFRKSVGFASVTLNIVNDDRALSNDSDLVSVTRKLYRNGDSEYIINGNQVRLKDIVELFMDTGLGKDGYSIIGQGRISDIISSKSNERREIFEEAAGIAKFRSKKEEAQRRLNNAESNMLRLKDILAELEGRVEPLRIQSEKALKARVLREEEKGIQISVWTKQIEDLKSRLNEYSDLLLVSNGEYEALTNEIDNIDVEIDELFNQSVACEVKMDELREEVKKIEQENYNFNATIAVCENDILHMNQSVKELEESKQKSVDLRDVFEREIDKKLEEIERLDGEIEKVGASVEKTKNELETLDNESGEMNQGLSEFSSKINELYIKKSELVFKISASKAVLSDSDGSKEKSETILKELDFAISSNEKEKAEVLESLNAVEDEISAHSNKLSGYSKLYDGKKTQLDKTGLDLSEMELKVHNLNSRKQILTDLENNMQGFQESVKSVLKAGKQGQIIGIHGSVGQLVSTESKYSVAIETALGGYLQNVVVENEDVAKRCMKLLKDTNGGRATFLPLTSVKGNLLNENNLDMQEGFVALGCELVKFDPKFEGIVRYMLGRVVVAEDIDFATKIAKKYGYKFKIVTLDGQVINAGGSFTGGSISKTAGVLTRRNEIDSLDGEIKKISGNLDILRRKLENLKQETTKLSYDIESEKEIISELNSDKIRCEEELKRIELSGTQLVDRKSEYLRNLDELSKKKLDAEKTKDESEKALLICEEDIKKLEDEVEDSKNKLEDIRLKREELSIKLSDYKISQTALLKDKETCEADIARVRQSVLDSDNDAEKILSQIELNKQSVEAKKREIEEIRKKMLSSSDEIDKINDKIREETKKRQNIEITSNSKRSLQKKKQDEREIVSRNITTYTERNEQVQRSYDSIISELWEKYNLSMSDMVSLYVPIEDIQSATKRLNEIKNKLRAIGTVNDSAVEEYKEVSERYEFLSSQLKDVETSKRELEKLIDSLTSEMTTIFSECFEKINSNFKTIFVELFGGGKAELALTDPDHILESGIEIYAAPPGKVIKNLSMLSGGEQAFVAIAIYFAIFMIKPSPFCILDEIEAALDDVNVTKYATYLRRFTDKTQFILITHRRGTMEEADVLYGVTMQEKGISKLLRMDPGAKNLPDNIVD